MLVARVLVPRNITFVVLGDHNFPVILRSGMAACLAGPAIHNRGARLLPAPDEDAGIGWVLQHAEDAWVDRLDPDHPAVAGLA